MSNLSKEPIKCRLARVKLNRDGYDEAGAYWGIGNPLYICEPVNTLELTGWYSWHLRARNREHAKKVVIARWPKATFTN